MNTTNYNSENFTEKNKNGELYTYNQSAMNEFNKIGKCNNCKHFNFGAKKCKATGRTLNITLNTPTNKGNFISYIRPSDCTEYANKGKNNSSKSDNKTDNNTEKKNSTS